MMTTLLLTLISIFGTVALTETVDLINNKTAKDKNVSSDDIIKYINAATAEASRKGDKVLNELNSRLANITLPYQASSSLRSYLLNIKNTAKNKFDKTVDKINELKKDEENIKARASTLAYQPASYRYSEAGKEELKGLLNESNNLEKEINKVEQGV